VFHTAVTLVRVVSVAIVTMLSVAIISNAFIVSFSWAHSPL